MALRMFPVIFIYHKQEAISRTIQIESITSQFIYKRLHLAESMNILTMIFFVTSQLYCTLYTV
jgi:hypothetical protein